jgi:DNA methylase
MIKTQDIVRGYKTAEARWARFGPYYAMFPLDFAFKVIEKYSKEGDFVIDPFAGRGSSIYAGSVLGRASLGIEINPVGWLYGSVKLRPADEDSVKDRLLEIYSKRNYYSRAIERMPRFYRMCYSDEVLKFLLAARHYLAWRTNETDATLMAILVVYLHGKLGEGLSNQMRMTKAMGMKYSIKWWRENGLSKPPEINIIEFVTKKIDWRYKKGKPTNVDSRILFGDSTIELNKIVTRANDNDIRFSLLFTSPPYCDVTDYHNDQWLRLWLMGGSEIPEYNNEKHKGRFSSKPDYYELLDSVFGQCSRMMADQSTIYVRTDKRDYTHDITKQVLKKHYPDYLYRTIKKPFTKRTQTEIMGNTSNEDGEVDIILTRR